MPVARVLGGLGLGLARHADLVDPPPLGVEHFDAQAVDLEPLADRRHAAEVRQEVAADGLEPFALDRARSAAARTSSMSTLPLNDEAAVAFVDDRLGLDVVLVADLADDFLEQVLDRHQAGGAAVLVHDDRDLRLLALKLLQQLRHALASPARRPPAAAAS